MVETVAVVGDHGQQLVRGQAGNLQTTDVGETRDARAETVLRRKRGIEFVEHK